MKSCVIVGAGIAGLLAATRLKETGHDVVVLEKDSEVGGRMAARHLNDGVMDYGAQFFTVRSEQFRALVDEWQAAGWVVEWSRGFPGADGQPNDDGYPRYRGEVDMAAVPRHLAQGLGVRLLTPVSAIHAGDHQWRIETETRDTLTADSLILTPPVPQTLDLLSAGDVALPQPAQASLQQIEYDPCIAVLALLDGPSIIPQPGAVQIDEEPVRWLADNTRKGISPDAYSITIHGAVGFSRDHWETDRTEAGRMLIDAVRRWLGTAHVREFQTHGWRYSQPVDVYGEDCLLVDDPLPLVFAGDAFAGPRVEGAALSGLAAAERLIDLGRRS